MDSDSDTDSDGQENVGAITSTLGSIADIEALKEQSSELLNSSWKTPKNKSLLTKMLELEEPSITSKMIDFLLQDGVCELLLGFITLTGSTERRL